jgi:hypothetical protein
VQIVASDPTTLPCRQALAQSRACRDLLTRARDVVKSGVSALTARQPLASAGSDPPPSSSGVLRRVFATSGATSWRPRRLLVIYGVNVCVSTTVSQPLLGTVNGGWAHVGPW